MKITKQRFSATPGAIPDSSTVQPGELILNLADGRLFYKDPLGDIRYISGNDTLQRVQTWAGRAGVVVPQQGDYDASDIDFVPPLNFAPDNLQEAVEYLIDQKSNIDHRHQWSEIQGKPTTLPLGWTVEWEALRNAPPFSGLAFLQTPQDRSLVLLGDGTWGAVTPRVQWAQIENKPLVFPAAQQADRQVFWDTIEGKPVSFPSSWNTLANKPVFGTIASIDLSQDSLQLLNGQGDWVSVETIVSLQQQTWSEIIDKPSSFESSWSLVKNKPTFGTIVAVSLTNSSTDILRGDGTWGPITLTGSVTWDNILMKPTTFPSDWGLISGKPSFGSLSLLDTSGNQNQVLRGDGTWGTPTIATSASVAWADITGKPIFGTVSAIDLTANANRYLNGSGAFAAVTWAQIVSKPTFGTVSAVSLSGNPGEYLNGVGAWTTISGSGTWAGITGKPTFGTVSAVNLNSDAASVLSGVGAWLNISTLPVAWSSVASKPAWLAGNGNVAQYLRGDLTFGGLAWADITGKVINWTDISGRPAFGQLSLLDLPTPASATRYLNGLGQWALINFLDSDTVISGGTY